MTVSVGSRAFISQGGVEVDAQVIDYKFATWRRVIPAGRQAGTLTVNAGEAEAVMAEAMIVAASDKAGLYVALDICAAGIRVTAGAADNGGYEGTIACSPSLPMMVDFNVAALREIFSMFPKSAAVQIDYTPMQEREQPKPLVFRSESVPGYTALYMPRRV